MERDVFLRQLAVGLDVPLEVLWLDTVAWWELLGRKAATYPRERTHARDGESGGEE